jgi:lipoprotein-anchoring transpeptidase ErfK/SrfK
MMHLRYRPAATWPLPAILQPASAASPRPRRPRIALGILTAAIASAAALATGCSHDVPARPAAAAEVHAGSAGREPEHVSAPAGWSLIATTKGTIPRFATPGGRKDGTVPGRWYGGLSSLPVIGQQPGWFRVRLVTRPNGSTAWVRAADVTITATPYRIVVDLASEHLRLYRLGKEIMNAAAGIGTRQDPTPTGQYFVAMFEESPSAGYGPFILVTSAHSDTIRDWEGFGDAVIGIHGPVGEGSQIGTSGAALSHGCIRLQLPDLARLRPVPVGTPISITA